MARRPRVSSPPRRREASSRGSGKERATAGRSSSSRHANRLKGPTAADVARSIGVSQATVSLVLTGKDQGRVSAETRASVLRAAATMGYRPHSAARNLRLGRADAVGLVIPDIENPYFATLFLGVAGAVRSADYAVIVFDERENPRWERSLSSGLTAGLFDGGILHTPDQRLTQDLVRKDGPLVLIESEVEGVASVQLGIVAGVRAAMDHLISLGHRRIGHVAAAYEKETFALRRQVWLTATRELGEPTREVRSTWELDSAEIAVMGLLAIADRPTALLCDDDLLAAAAYRAARKLGVRIPRDLSVVGIDDIPLARYLEPELTTIALPGLEIGRAAGSLLLERILRPADPPGRVDIALPLVIRGSTAAPSIAD